MPEIKKKTVLLSCGHTNTFEPPPARDDSVYCYKCNGWFLVKSGGTYKDQIQDYSVKCRNCKYARNYGASQLEAEVRASAHRRRCPEHTVDLYDMSGECYATYEPPTLDKLF